jgi:hypothetical protein
VDQSDRDTWTNQIAPRRSRPHSRPASASPPSRPPLARAGAPARARARRYRPLSPGASAIARRRPLARLSPARGRQRPLLARAAARTVTSLTVAKNPVSEDIHSEVLYPHKVRYREKFAAASKYSINYPKLKESKHVPRKLIHPCKFSWHKK